MKYLSTLLLLLSGWVGMGATPPPEKPLPSRRVTGTLLNERGQGIPGATIRLTSTQDTLAVSTGLGGRFTFPNVKQAEFTLAVQRLGYEPFVGKFFQNDTESTIELEPITLGVRTELLEAVSISRQRGYIVRGDTTEYWAADYRVRDYARLKDLLERLEGITIDADGRVFHQGDQIKKALFNNEKYFTGSIAEILNDLPASIIERIQVVERGPGGERPRLTNTEPTEKVLNVVTKRDQSAGRMLGLSAEAGTGDRQRFNLSFKRIDGADQTAVEGAYHSEPAGVKSSTVPGSVSAFNSSNGLQVVSHTEPYAGGKDQQLSAAVSHNFVGEGYSWEPRYSFSQNDGRTQSEELSDYQYLEGPLQSFRSSSNTQRRQAHQLSLGIRKRRRQNPNMEMASLPPALRSRFLSGRGFSARLSGNHSNSTNLSNALAYREGIVHSLESAIGTSENTHSSISTLWSFGLPIGPQWLLHGVGNVHYSSGHSNATSVSSVYALEDALRQDWEDLKQRHWDAAEADSSLAQQRTLNSNSTRGNLELSFSRAWNARTTLAIQFNPALGHHFNDTYVLASANGESFAHLPLLDQFKDEISLGIPVSIAPQYVFENGLTVSASILFDNRLTSGRWQRNGARTERWSQSWSPKLTFLYVNPSLGRIQWNLIADQAHPALLHLNPDTVYSSPFSFHIGNPDLQNTHTLSTDLNYSHYFRNQALNINYRSSFEHTVRRIVGDQHLMVAQDDAVLIQGLQYKNIRGGHKHRQDVTIRKTFTKSAVTYSVGIMGESAPYYAAGSKENLRAFSHSHQVRLRVPTDLWMDVTAAISYRSHERENSLASSNRVAQFHKAFDAGGELAFFLPQDFRINVATSYAIKRMTSLLEPHDPLVVNANMEKRFLRNKTMILSFVVMDLAKQHYDTHPVFDSYGYTSVLNNRNSRYFLLQLSWRPEQWTASRRDIGQSRRNDGSLL